MPERSRKRSRDINELAAQIVAEATGDGVDAKAEVEVVPEPAGAGKDPAAVALGRRGGLKGGRARAERMTPEERSEAARKAAAARWKRDVTP